MSEGKRATQTPERTEKKTLVLAGGETVTKRERDPTTGKFVTGNAGGPGRPPRPPKMRELAEADRQANFDYIRGLRDDPKADPELRFEAAKLLAQYSDGKPSL